MHDTRCPRGFTLIELMVTLAVTSIVMALGVGAAMTLDSGRRPRELTAKIQGEGRQGLAFLEADLRRASLGVGSGVIWSAPGGNRAGRPAVQLFDDVNALNDGTGFLNPKPHTDALLIVSGAVGPSEATSTATVGEITATTGAISVTNAGGLAAGDNVLLGEYQDAVWIPLTAVATGVTPNTVTSGLAGSILPGTQAGKIGAGALVRRARARLYFVNTRDELVRADLSVPYAPASAAQVTGMTAIAQGIENLQLNCSVAGVTAFVACPAPSAAASEATEATAALGAFGGAGGRRLDLTTIPTLRTIAMSVSVRSDKLPSGSNLADAPVALEGVTLQASSAPTAQYIRRTYRLGVAVRNTSLESF
jgi:prepilin-type N-terminal cleavage/methylation domain-containing protein